MKTMRIVILDEEGARAEAVLGRPGLDLRSLEGLNGHDVAELLREHARPTPFVDTAPDALIDLPDVHQFEADLQDALHATLHAQSAGHPLALLLGPGSSDADIAHRAGSRPSTLPFERLNTSLVRALRRHELEAALAESEVRLQRLGLSERQTGLPSRELFLDRLEQAAAAVLRGGVSFATLMIGVELSATERDTLSEGAITSLLAIMGQRLGEVGRRSDSYARIGGHSFAALLLGNNSVGGSLAMAHKIAQELSKPVSLDGRLLQPVLAVGVALCPQHGTDARSMLLHAHGAMEQAQLSRDGVAVYDARLQRTGRTGWISTASDSAGALLPGDDALAPLLADAIERHELTLAYQPVMTLQGTPGDPAPRPQLRRLAALARWYTPALGHISPAVFIPVAEHHALIGALTDQLLEMALAQASPWREQDLVPALSLHLSAQVLEDRDFPARVALALNRYAWPASALVLELPAAALAQPGTLALGVLAELAHLGVRLSIDDFGSGLGSYLTLAELGTLAELKVDVQALAPGNATMHSLIDLEREHRNSAILRSVVTLAQGLGAEVVAKGVSSAATVAWLRELGCHTAQGHLWGRALPADQVRAWCVNHTAGPC